VSPPPRPIAWPRREPRAQGSIKPVEVATGLTSADFNANRQNFAEPRHVRYRRVAGLFCRTSSSAVSLHTREATRPRPSLARDHEAHASPVDFRRARDRVLAVQSIDGSGSPPLPLRHPHKLRGHLQTECSRAPDRHPGQLFGRGNRRRSPVSERAGPPFLIKATEPAVALNPTELSANWPNLSSDDTHRD
jgi:hypothetical protein